MKKLLTKSLALSLVAFLAACSDDDSPGNTNQNQNQTGAICGNGRVEGTEECDDGAQNSDIAPDACRASCTLPGCGDWVIDTGEECDDGPQNSDLVPDACRADCTLPGCGDGVVDVASGETCDDGNDEAGDGCSPDCWVEFCGNGELDPGEVCDDGNFQAGDGCSPDCQSEETCGNGILDSAAGESCDCGTDPENLPAGCAAPNGDLASECSADCQTRYCGNGRIDPGELCDDGNSKAGDGCSPDCQSNESCGNGILDTATGESCDCGTDPENLPTGCTAPNGDPLSGCSADCQTRYCGNGRIDPGELCDDGNNQAGDGCSPDCRSNETCGNGITDPVNLEECDDANLEDGDGCNMLCRIERCGNSYVEPNELCDDGNTLPGDGCSPDCLSDETCGNGYVDWALGEQCDDGNLLSHDGCASCCMTESPTWTERVPSSLPPARVDTAVAFDPGRGALVLYGGYGPAGTLGDTWEWSNGAWRKISPPMSPGPRVYHQMVYDAAIRRVVLFGGGPDLMWSYDSSIWEWDGQTWTKRTAATQPPPRVLHQMVYDSKRKVVVVQGGYNYHSINGFVPIPDTWEWDSERRLWSLASPGPSSIVNPQPFMAYDPVRGVTVMVDSGSFPTQDGTTWEWDGAQWTELSTPLPAAAKPYLAMGYHTGLGRIVMQGSGTWAFDGSTWEDLGLSTAPPPQGSAPAQDPADKRILLLINTTYPTPLLELWQLGEAGWSLIPPPSAPPARAWHGMAFDEARGRAVLFGGQTQTSQRFDDTWEWNGASWVEHAPPSRPPARSGPMMAYDAARERTVLFGGVTAGGDIGDTWEWDGTSWQQKLPARSPSARCAGAMAYDRNSQRIVLFGGWGNGGELNDTWEWDGTDWSEMSPNFVPEGRWAAAMAFDPQSSSVLLHGGVSTLGTEMGDAWAWYFGDWLKLGEDYATARASHTAASDSIRGRMLVTAGYSQMLATGTTLEWDITHFNWVDTNTSPPARSDSNMVFDPLRAQMLLFGGANESGSTYLADTWILSWSAPLGAYEVCDLGMDLDNDGLAGCDDPDCQAWCASCGDGTCGPLENCRLCPGDCGTCYVCGDFFCDPGETCAGCPGDCGPC